MDDLFKQKLAKLRQPVSPKTFAEALFGDVSWAQKIHFKQVDEAPAIKERTFSEKGQVLESLERFAQEKFEEQGTTSIKIMGGEISYRPDPVWDGIEQAQSYQDLKMGLSVDAQSLDLTLQSKIAGQVRIMFVPEEYRKIEDYKDEMKEGLINQLLPAFPAKIAEFFSKMIAAMKLDESEIILYPVMNHGQDLSREVMKVAAFYRPEIIVTLGANATHKILQSQERLTQVHGQFFNRKIENIGTFIVVPLFHPSIIENNQNMKKTAWLDMQKMMKQLKKL